MNTKHVNYIEVQSICHTFALTLSIWMLTLTQWNPIAYMPIFSQHKCLNKLQGHLQSANTYIHNLNLLSALCHQNSIEHHKHDSIMVKMSLNRLLHSQGLPSMCQSSVQLIFGSSLQTICKSALCLCQIVNTWRARVVKLNENDILHPFRCGLWHHITNSGYTELLKDEICSLMCFVKGM